MLKYIKNLKMIINNKYKKNLKDRNVTSKLEE